MLGIAITVAIIVLILLVLPVREIAKLASAFQLLMFAFLCVAVIAMRESKIDSYDPSFRSPLYPWLHIFGIIAPIFLISKMGWMPLLFSVGLIAFSMIWYFQYARNRVAREGAIFHVFQRLGERRHEALDAELRTIMVEKGLREEDPFDDIVARSHVIDCPDTATYEDAVEFASKILAQYANDSASHLKEGFKRSVCVGATSFTRGGALPHLKIPNLEHPELVLVRSRSGIRVDYFDDFGDAHVADEPIRAFFFLISADENPGQHLRILAHIASHLESDEFMDEWMAADNEQEIKESLLRNERYVSLSIKRGNATESFIDKKVANLNLPPGTLLAIVRRGDYTMVPRPATKLHEGDRITIIGDPRVIEELYETYH